MCVFVFRDWLNSIREQAKSALALRSIRPEARLWNAPSEVDSLKWMTTPLGIRCCSEKNKLRLCAHLFVCIRWGAIFASAARLLFIHSMASAIASMPADSDSLRRRFIDWTRANAFVQIVAWFSFGWISDLLCARVIIVIGSGAEVSVRRWVFWKDYHARRGDDAGAGLKVRIACGFVLSSSQWIDAACGVGFVQRRSVDGSGASFTSDNRMWSSMEVAYEICMRLDVLFIRILLKFWWIRSLMCASVSVEYFLCISVYQIGFGLVDDLNGYFPGFLSVQEIRMNIFNLLILFEKVNSHYLVNFSTNKSFLGSFEQKLHKRTTHSLQIGIRKRFESQSFSVETTAAAAAAASSVAIQELKFASADFGWGGRNASRSIRIQHGPCFCIVRRAHTSIIMHSSSFASRVTFKHANELNPCRTFVSKRKHSTGMSAFSPRLLLLRMRTSSGCGFYVFSTTSM